MNKKMLMTLIGFGLVVILCFSTLIVNILSGTMDSEPNSTTIQEQKKEPLEEEKIEIDKGIEENTKDDYNEYLVEEGALPLTETKAKIVIKDYDLALSKFDFIKAQEVLQVSLTDNKFDESEGAKKILQLYDENAIMGQFGYMSEKNDFELIQQIIKENIKDPYSYLISTLWLESTLRADFIWEGASLNPEFYGDVTLNQINNLDHTESYFQDCLRIWGDTKEVIQYDITIEKNPLYAYVGIRENGDPFLLRIDEQTPDSTYYYTVDEWREIEKQLIEPKE